jgi:aspartokinase
MPLDDLVDQLRALNFDLARFSSAEQEATIEAAATEIERLRAREAEAATIIAEAVVDHDAMEAEIALIKKENDAVWDAIKVLGDYLTSEEISEELKRRGFDAANAFARIKVVLRAKKGS